MYRHTESWPCSELCGYSWATSLALILGFTLTCTHERTRRRAYKRTTTHKHTSALKRMDEKSESAVPKREKIPLISREKINTAESSSECYWISPTSSSALTPAIKICLLQARGASCTASHSFLNGRTYFWLRALQPPLQGQQPPAWPYLQAAACAVDEDPALNATRSAARFERQGRRSAREMYKSRSREAWPWYGSLKIQKDNRCCEIPEFFAIVNACALSTRARFFFARGER